MSPPSPSPLSLLLQFLLPFFFFFFLLSIVKLSAEEDPCNSSTVCKNNMTISHPFWRIDHTDKVPINCQLPNFGVKCSNSDPDYPLIAINGHDYLVRNISYPEHSITLVDSQLKNVTIPLEKDDDCSLWRELQPSLDLPETAPFSFDSRIDLNITIVSNCTLPLPGGIPRSHGIGCGSYLFVWPIDPLGLDWIGNCNGRIETAVMKTWEMESVNWKLNASFRAALKLGFVLGWETEVEEEPTQHKEGGTNFISQDNEGGAGGGREFDQFLKCNSTRYNCGEIRDVGYPFWGKDRPKECGHPSFHLDCDDVRNETTIVIDSLSPRVLEITKYTMKIARTDLLNGECPRNGTWPAAPDGAFTYFPDVGNATLHFGRCRFLAKNVTQDYATRLAFRCRRADGGGIANVTVSFPSVGPDAVECDGGASEMSVLISKLGLFEELEKNDTSTNVLDVLNQGVTMWYNGSIENCLACEKTDGVCWLNTSLVGEPTCLCRDGIFPYFCGSPGQGLSARSKIAIGIGVGSAFGAIAIGAWWFMNKKKKKKKHYTSSYFMSRSIGSDPSSLALDLEKAGDYHGVQRFAYSELEQATENFHPKHELGDGGFGSVYKGKLRDGRVVAVKRLYENNYKRVEQFMNEIEILHRLSHKNLVRLYGCTSRNARELILVYEYIPNGTIADHLHGEAADPGRLPWATRLNIAVETASALAYLHASEVIHRDVKTNNILLDDGFRVKVADFGLSRLFPTHATHVSTAPQGTPGYLDPEYHECYQLTSKSDVYSFGVVLVELISGLPAVDITRHRHEINLSNMAVAKIQCNALHELVDPTLGFETDERVRGAVCAVAEVAFQCLQGGKDMRPTMGEVLESLVEIQGLGGDEGVGREEKKVSSVMGSPLVDAPLLCSSKSSTDNSSNNIKNVPALSPNSVVAKWPSRSTTHSSSGC